MKNVKITLFLVSIVVALFFLMTLEGGLSLLEKPWKEIINLTFAPQRSLELSALTQSFLVFITLMLSVVLGLKMNNNKERFLVTAFVGGLMISGSFLFSLYHYFWNPFPLELVLILSSGVVSFFSFTAIGARKTRLHQLFDGRLSLQIIEKLIESEVSLQFPGELKHGSILVMTLSNHAELMEALTPENYVQMTTLYLQVASNFLVDVGGYLEECSGESIRSIFGVPLPLTGSMNHAAKAVRTALELVKRLEELNRECDLRWQQRLDFRIGIHSGEMLAAFYGTPRFNQYSVAGPTIEFARYLSMLCLKYGCRILVGPNTYEMAENNAEFRPMDLLEYQGNCRYVELYEVLAPKNALSRERERSRDLFWQGILSFRSEDFDQAREAFSAARIFGIPDKALDLYLERIDKNRREKKTQEHQI